VPTPKKPRKLPPRGQKGRFIKSRELARFREPEPELVESPVYSPHRVGMGELIDWQRELSREVLPPRRRSNRPRFERLPGTGGPQDSPKLEKLTWGVLAVGAIGIGYALSRLPSKGRHL
jgi:hypothetical protein